MARRDVGFMPVFEETDSASSSSSSSSSSASSRVAENGAAFFLYGRGAGRGAGRGDRGDGPATAAERAALEAVLAAQHRSEAMQTVSRYFRHRGALPFEQSAVLFPDVAAVLTGTEGPPPSPLSPHEAREAARERDVVQPEVFHSGGAGTTALNLLATSPQATSSTSAAAVAAAVRTPERFMAEPAVAAATAGALGGRHTNTIARASPPRASHRAESKQSKTTSKKDARRAKKLTSVVGTQSTSAPAPLTSHMESGAVLPEASSATETPPSMPIAPSEGDNISTTRVSSPPSSAHLPPQARRLLPTFSAMEERQLFNESSENDADDDTDGAFAQRAEPTAEVPVFTSETAARRYYADDMEAKVGLGGVPTLRSHLYFEQPNGLFVDRRAHSQLVQQREVRLARLAAQEEEEKQKRDAWNRLHRGSRRLAMLSGSSGGGGGGGGGGSGEKDDSHSHHHRHKHTQDGDAPPVSWEEQREDALLYRLRMLSLLRYMMRVYYFLSAFTCGVAVLTLILACTPALSGSEALDITTPTDATVHAFPSRLSLTVALLAVFDPSLFLFLCLLLIVTGLSPLAWSVAEGQWIQSRLEQMHAQSAITSADAGVDNNNNNNNNNNNACAAPTVNHLLGASTSVVHGHALDQTASAVSGHGHVRRQTGWPGARRLPSGGVENDSAPLQPQESLPFTLSPPRRVSSNMDMSMPSLAQRRVSTRLSLVPSSGAWPARHATSSLRHGTFATTALTPTHVPWNPTGLDDGRDVSGVRLARPRSLSLSTGLPGARQACPSMGVSFSVPSAGLAPGISAGSIGPNVTAPSVVVPASPAELKDGDANLATGLSAAWQGTLSGTQVPDYYTHALAYILDGTLHADNVATRVLEDTQRRVLGACVGRSWTAQSFWLLLQPRHWFCWVCLALTIVELAMVDGRTTAELLFSDKADASEGGFVTVLFAIIVVRAVLFSIIWLLNVFF